MCRCLDLRGLELVLCLAPPPGEYELHIAVSRDKYIVINREGVYLRQLVTDETLPFMNTYQRPIPIKRAVELAKLSPEELTCLAVSHLKKAASSGSITALKTLRECLNLINSIEETCIK